jgi:8-oxo-dGTP pyrophosphatase MutT (NUDIX family)
MLNHNIFLNRKPGIIGEEQFRQYAVLIPILKESEDSFLLFEKRASNLRRQPGEICFPGGKLEPGESLLECAVRETIEELCIHQYQIKIIGPGDIFISPFNLVIHPFIGEIKEYQNTFSTEEVEEIIKIPLEFFRRGQPAKFKSKLINEPAEDFPYEWIPGGENYPWAKGSYDILFYQYENHIIWGMTARIVKSAVELIDQYKIGFYF